MARLLSTVIVFLLQVLKLWCLVLVAHVSCLLKTKIKRTLYACVAEKGGVQ